MKNMKVSLKLIVSFLIIAAMAGIVGAVGIIGLLQMEEKDNELYYSNLIAISAMADVREAYQSERTQLREVILAIGDPNAVQSGINQFTALEKTILDAMTVYEGTIDNPDDEQGYYNAKKTYQGDYATIKKKILDAAAAGDFELANATLADARTVVAPIVSGLQEAATLNNSWAAATVTGNSALARTLIFVQVGVLLLAIATALFFAFYISGLISKPLAVLTNFMKRAGTTGDINLTQEDSANISEVSKIRDEIGECIKSTSQFVAHLIDVSDELEKIANNDLTANIDLLSDKDVMGVSLNKTAANLNSMFMEIRTASEQVSSGASQVSQGAQGLASGSSQQAASIEELSASLTELQEKTDHNAQDSANAREANNKTADQLESSINSMGHMLDAMKAIDESSSNITKVIKVIDDIAFQTNILALNAAVEAARAGQHGKGFAVVADEVRNLAAKSAEAAKETSALIEGSSERVKEGNQIVVKTNADLEAAVNNARESTRLIEQVATASIEQASSITEINQGMEQISTVVQANSATAEESAAAAQEMSAQSQVMNDIVSRFRLKGQNDRASSGYSSQPSTTHYSRPNTETTGFALGGGKY